MSARDGPHAQRRAPSVVYKRPLLTTKDGLDRCECFNDVSAKRASHTPEICLRRVSNHRVRNVPICLVLVSSGVKHARWLSSVHGGHLCGHPRMFVSHVMRCSGRPQVTGPVHHPGTGRQGGRPGGVGGAVACAAGARPPSTPGRAPAAVSPSGAAPGPVAAPRPGAHRGPCHLAGGQHSWQVGAGAVQGERGRLTPPQLAILIRKEQERCITTYDAPLA